MDDVPAHAVSTEAVPAGTSLSTLVPLRTSLASRRVCARPRTGIGLSGRHLPKRLPGERESFFGRAERFLSFGQFSAAGVHRALHRVDVAARFVDLVLPLFQCLREAPAPLLVFDVLSASRPCRPGVRERFGHAARSGVGVLRT